MGRYYNSLALLEEVDVLVAASDQSQVIDISGYSEVVFQWLLSTSGGRGEFEVYASVLPPNDSRLANTDPDVNRFWCLVETASGSPIIPDSDGILDCSYGTIDNNSFRSCIVRYTATVLTVGMTLLVGMTGDH